MTAIPWQTPEQFREAGFFLETMDRRRPHAFDKVRADAGKIFGMLTGLDPDMDRICRLTCPDCRENCCARATIWYDFKDLLFIYFSGLPLPERQVERRCKGSGAPACGYLTTGGCRLPRTRRPFVCTWYVCGAQKRLDQKGAQGYGRIQEKISRIKFLREKMEAEFCSACV